MDRIRDFGGEVLDRLEGRGRKIMAALVAALALVGGGAAGVEHNHKLDRRDVETVFGHMPEEVSSAYRNILDGTENRHSANSIFANLDEKFKKDLNGNYVNFHRFNQATGAIEIGDSVYEDPNSPRAFVAEEYLHDLEQPMVIFPGKIEMEFLQPAELNEVVAIGPDGQAFTKKIKEVNSYAFVNPQIIIGEDGITFRGYGAEHMPAKLLEIKLSWAEYVVMVSYAEPKSAMIVDGQEQDSNFLGGYITEAQGRGPIFDPLETDHPIPYEAYSIFDGETGNKDFFENANSRVIDNFKNKIMSKLLSAKQYWGDIKDSRNFGNGELTFEQQGCELVVGVEQEIKPDRFSNDKETGVVTISLPYALENEVRD